MTDSTGAIRKMGNSSSKSGFSQQGDYTPFTLPLSGKQFIFPSSRKLSANVILLGQMAENPGASGETCSVRSGAGADERTGVILGSPSSKPAATKRDEPFDNQTEQI